MPVIFKKKREKNHRLSAEIINAVQLKALNVSVTPSTVNTSSSSSNSTGCQNYIQAAEFVVDIHVLPNHTKCEIQARKLKNIQNEVLALWNDSGNRSLVS